MKDNANPSDVNQLLTRFRLMQADQLCTWICARAGVYSWSERKALEIYVPELEAKKGRVA